MLIQLTEDELARISIMAASERRTSEQQAAWLIALALDVTEARDRECDRKRDQAARKARSRASKRVTNVVTDPVTHAVTSPPSSLSLSPPLSSLTLPSNPSAHPLSPTPTHIHARDDRFNEVPFSEPLEPLDPEQEPEVKLTTPALQRTATPAPKPKKMAKRFAYSEAFEAFWMTWTGGGVKSLAYEQWVAHDLDGDEAQRGRVLRVLEAQIAHKATQIRTTGFSPQFSHAERWLRDAQWENKLEGMAPLEMNAAPNPYEHQPWGPIWTQTGWKENEMGVMNFASKLDADANQARDEYRRNGFLAAVALAWTHRQAV